MSELHHDLRYSRRARDQQACDDRDQYQAEQVRGFPALNRSSNNCRNRNARETKADYFGSRVRALLNCLLPRMALNNHPQADTKETAAVTNIICLKENPFCAIESAACSSSGEILNACQQIAQRKEIQRRPWFESRIC